MQGLTGLALPSDAACSGSADACSERGRRYGLDRSAVSGGQPTPMQRVVIMGPPGSGKSTLARQLGVRHGLPVFHLDRAYWQPGWAETSPQAFRAEVERLSGLPAWIIEGNYTATIAPRLSAADTVIYLDVPALISVIRLIRRTLLNHGRVRPDSAPGCPERFDIAFLRFAWSWNRIRRARNLAMIARFPGLRVIVATRSDLRRVLTMCPDAEKAGSPQPLR